MRRPRAGRHGSSSLYRRLHLLVRRHHSSYGHCVITFQRLHHQWSQSPSRRCHRHRRPLTRLLCLLATANVSVHRPSSCLAQWVRHAAQSPACARSGPRAASSASRPQLVSSLSASARRANAKWSSPRSTVRAAHSSAAPPRSPLTASTKGRATPTCTRPWARRSSRWRSRARRAASSLTGRRGRARRTTRGRWCCRGSWRRSSSRARMPSSSPRCSCTRTSSRTFSHR